jgi:hypothetical protein
MTDKYKETCGLVNKQVEACLSQIIDIVLEEYGLENETF